MGDYLDTKVKTCNTDSFNCTRMCLEYDHGTADFELPISLNLKKGEGISFYQGCVRGGHIYHSDYIRAEITIEGMSMLSLNARDMRILTELREAEKERI